MEKLTVATKQWDSRMAPQHPKNAIKNTIAPITMNTIGAILMFGSLIAFIISSYFSKKAAPTDIKAMPHSWKEKKGNIRINGNME